MPRITAKNITIRLFDKLMFQNTSFVITQGEHIAVVGPNGAGKTTLAKAIAGKLPIIQGEITSSKPLRVSYISFESHERLAKKIEQWEEFQSFSARELEKLTVKRLLGQSHDMIKTLLHKPLAALSNGEMRKVLLAKELLKNPNLLILDEPFDGLDEASQTMLKQLLQSLMKKITIVLITHRVEELLPEIKRIFYIEDGKIKAIKKSILRHPEFSSESQMLKQVQHDTVIKQTIIAMHNISIQYGKNKVLDNFSWTMREGEHWAIVGPNGAGKSTLVELIYGDNLQGYANDITLFGKKKDEQSLWDIRKHIGLLSSELHLSYDEDIKAFSVVVSGLFDSIGLYQKPSAKQISQANNIIKKLHIAHLAEKKFQTLSLGEKRMTLLARALIKQPKLLILDEPTNGLDTKNRKLFFSLIENIARENKTSIIYITHHKNEIPTCMTNTLTLG